MKSGLFLTICRKWNNPKIQINVTDKEIRLSFELEDFVNGVVEEFGSPALVMTKAQFADRINKAVEKVITEVKKESIKVT